MGHTDKNTAYAAVNRIRCNDMRPHIYKTTNGGKTWTEIVNGLPDDPINVVKEDQSGRDYCLLEANGRCMFLLTMAPTGNR